MIQSSFNTTNVVQQYSEIAVIPVELYYLGLPIIFPTCLRNFASDMLLHPLKVEYLMVLQVTSTLSSELELGVDPGVD